MFDEASCAGYGVGDDGSGRGYGLGADPFLADLGFNPFKVIAAPFKAGAKVVKFGVKTAVRVAPRAAVGFLTAGPAGAAAGIASTLISPSGERVEQPAFAQTSYTGTPTGSGARYTTMGPGSGLVPAQNPYAREQSPYYSAPKPAPSFQDSIRAAGNLLRDELLGAGGRMIAATPAGQAGIREKFTGDIGRYLLPISLGVGGLLLVMALTRR